MQVCTDCRQRPAVRVESEDRRLHYACEECKPGLRKWMARSDAAKRAVVTKRQKYKHWPDKRNTHK